MYLSPTLPNSSFHPGSNIVLNTRFLYLLQDVSERIITNYSSGSCWGGNQRECARGETQNDRGGCAHSTRSPVCRERTERRPELQGPDSAGFLFQIVSRQILKHQDILLTENVFFKSHFFENSSISSSSESQAARCPAPRTRLCQQTNGRCIQSLLPETSPDRHGRASVEPQALQILLWILNPFAENSGREVH